MTFIMTSSKKLNAATGAVLSALLSLPIRMLLSTILKTKINTMADMIWYMFCLFMKSKKYVNTITQEVIWISYD